METSDLKVVLTAPSGGGKTVLLSAFSKVLSMGNRAENGFYISGRDMGDLSKVYFQMVQQCHWPAPTEIGEFFSYEFQMYPYDSIKQAVPPLINFGYFDFPGEITTKTKAEIKDEAEMRCFEAYREVQETCDVHVVALDGLKLVGLIKGGIQTKDGKPCKAFNEAILSKTKANMAAQLFTALNHSIQIGDLHMPDSKPLLIAITKWDIVKSFGISLENVKTFLLSAEVGLSDELMRVPRDIILIPVSVTGDKKTFMNVTETGVSIDIINKEFTPYNINILFNLVFYTAIKARLDNIMRDYMAVRDDGEKELQARKAELDAKLREIESKQGVWGLLGRMRRRVVDAYEKVTSEHGMTERDMLAMALMKIKEDSFIEEELDKDGKIPYLRKVLLNMKDALDRNINGYMYLKRK